MNKLFIYGCAIAFSIAACQSPEKDGKTATTTETNSVQKSQTTKTVAMTNLQTQLDARRDAMAKSWSTEKSALHQNGIDEVVKSGITTKAVQVGQKAPDFTLVNQLGKEVKLSETLKSGPVVLTWYRGGWCPYCNLTLNALQAKLPEFKAEKASLLALTPEKADKSLSTAEKNNLEFEVLTDLHNKVGKEFGVVFKLEDEVAKAYQNGFDLHAYNGDDSDELPLSATYIIGQDGVVKYAFLDGDYRNRAEPSTIVEELKKLK